MPPKDKNTYRNLSAADKELHEAIFEKAVRGARTMRELQARFNDDTPIPEYRYMLDSIKDAVLTGPQRDFLNGLDLTAEAKSSMNAALDAVKWHVDTWAKVIEEVGEPRATDKPLDWSAYDLWRIWSLAANCLYFVNHAVHYAERQPA